MGSGRSACLFSGDLAGDLAGKSTVAAMLGPPPTSSPLLKTLSQSLYLVSLRPLESLVQRNACGSSWKYASLSSGLSHRSPPPASPSCHLHCHFSLSPPSPHLSLCWGSLGQAPFTHCLSKGRDIPVQTAPALAHGGARWAERRPPAVLPGDHP